MRQPTLVKCFTLGDYKVGKSSLLYVYTQREFPPAEYPTIFDNYSAEHSVDGKKVNLGLWDSAGGEDYERLRPLSYPGTDLFLVCFAIDDPVSLQNVASKWIPEIRKHAPSTPFILIATKSDLRDDRDTAERLAAKGLKIVEFLEGKEFAAKHGALKFIECSAITQKNVDTVFEEAMRCVVQKETKNQKNCILL